MARVHRAAGPYCNAPTKAFAFVTKCNSHLSRIGWRSDHRPLRRRYRCRVPTQAGCGAVPPRRSGEAGPVRSQSSPGQDPPRGVRPVRGDEPSPARGGRAGDFRLPGLHALLHDDPERTLSAWSQTGRQTGQQDPGAHRRGAPQALAPRHLGGRQSGSGGSAKAGSTTLPSRGRAGSSVRSAAGYNACGCGRCAGGPNETASVGGVWSA